MRNRSRITSQSDQSDDDQIFTPVVHTRSRYPTNRHTRESSHNNEEADDSNNIEGTRRSTRKRKLKYENYSDTWIVGSQALKGYPNRVNEEDAPRRITRNLRLKQVEVDEEDDDDDDDLEDEDDEPDANADEQENEQNSVPQQSNDSKQEEKKKLSFTLENSDTRPRTRKAVAEASDKSNDKVSTPCNEDLYTRIKRSRRNRQTKPNTATEQSSDESMSSEELNNLSNIEDYLTSINVKKKRRRTIRLKQCSIRQSNRPRYYRYSLRKVKPTVQRFQIHTEKNTRAIKTPSKMVNGPRKRRASTSSSSSSSGMSVNDLDTSVNQTQAIKKPKGHTRDDKNKNKPSLEDIKPVVVDSGIGFHNIGGLQEHIDCLREMVVFPMIYRDVFEMFAQHPAKGVIFHGPPGTGKTLLARALANECSKGGQKVSFFVRKSADVLCKWVGESERQLRLLFDKAKEMKPSIIFFDELDGLVPVRSGKQDQVHNSIVTTMLAMMDGLETRGDVIVIGATNRIDSIDPALRRPGRFDKELYFPLPTDKDRLQILRIIVSKWKNNLPADEILVKLSEETVGYTGADLNSLCSESVLQALNRTYPQIYKTSKRLLLDLKKIQVKIEDFENAMSKIVPTTERNVVLNPKKLPSIYRPLYEETLEKFISYINNIFPELNSKSNQRLRVAKAPRLLVHNISDSKNVLVVPALLQHFENCYRHTLSCVTLYSNSINSPEEAIVQIFKELPKHLPAILFIPNIGEFWNGLSYSLQKLFFELLNSLDITLPVLIFATSLCNAKTLPEEVLDIFVSENQKYSIPDPSKKAVQSLYSVLLEKAFTLPVTSKQESLEELPIAPAPSPPKLSESELKNIIGQEENTLRELRIFLRDICAKLARNKQFFLFTKPVDIEEVPDYLEIIKEPMDLETVMSKIDKHCYICARDFLDDIDLIVRNALEYNPERSAEDKHIRHRACSLRDKAYAFIKAEMDSDFEDTCRDIRDKRKKRNATDIEQTCVPDFVHTIKKDLTTDDHLEESSGRKKKRRNMWQKGLTPKKKRYSKNVKDQDETANDSSNHPTPNGFDANGIDESSNDSIAWMDRSTSPSPTPNDSNCLELSPILKHELKIDKNLFQHFLKDDVIKFWDERIDLNVEIECIDDGVIDLFSLFDKKIGQYSQKWDRSTLLTELKREFEDFKFRYFDILEKRKKEIN